MCVCKLICVCVRLCVCVCKIRVLGNRRITQNLNDIHRYLGAVSKTDIDDVT